MGYSTIFVSFEGVSDGVFEAEANFCQGILNVCSKYFIEKNLPDSEVWVDSSVTTFDLLDTFLNKTCENKKIVLMIDEVDKTSNNFIFLKFLGLLRDKYLKRGRGAGTTFQSVILAGVYCLNLDSHDSRINRIFENIAEKSGKSDNRGYRGSDFKVDMSLNEKEIAPMLTEYEKEHNTGMDIEAIPKEIRAYTNGYPYLVSRICQCIESELERDWTHNGILNAIKIILVEQSTLFDDIAKNIKSNPDLKELLRELTVGKRMRSYNVDNDTIQLALTFGIIENRSGLVAIHNRIFEVRITNYFISEREEVECRAISSSLINMVRDKDNFDMPFFLEKFANHYYEIYNNKDIKFLERECRLLFVTYLKPYINGAGNYYLESEIRNSERTDVIIDYGSEQFIVELKLWYGEVAHENALDQIANYLDSKNKDIGYLLTFDFRKEQNVGKPQIRWVEHRGKKILDVMVGV
jgi:hypothetical protein